MLAQIKHYRGNHKITPGRPLCWSSCGSETFHSSLRLWTHNPKTRCCLPDVRSFCRYSDLITINYTSNQTNLSAINKIPGYCIFLKPNCNEAFVSWQLKMVLIEFWGLFMDTWVWWCYCDCEMLWFQLLQVKVMLYFQLVCFSCGQTCTFIFLHFTCPSSLCLLILMSSLHILLSHRHWLHTHTHTSASIHPLNHSCHSQHNVCFYNVSLSHSVFTSVMPWSNNSLQSTWACQTLKAHRCNINLPFFASMHPINVLSEISLWRVFFKSEEVPFKWWTCAEKEWARLSQGFVYECRLCRDRWGNMCEYLFWKRRLHYKFDRLCMYEYMYEYRYRCTKDVIDRKIYGWTDGRTDV